MTEATRLRAARLRRRTWMLLVAVPLAVAATVLGVRLATLGPLAAGAAADYEAGRFPDAAGTYEELTSVNVVERWKAPFDAGTARAADAAAGGSSAAYDAVDHLHAAYDLAEGEPPEVRCLVQTNLAIAYEVLGDSDRARAEQYAADLAALEEALAAREAGEPFDAEAIDPYGDGVELDPLEVEADVQAWYEYATESYRYGRSVRGWGDCGQADRSAEEQTKDEQAQQRLTEKADAAEAAQPDHADDPEPTPEPSSDAGAEAARQEQLQQQNQEAAETAEQEQQEDRDTWGDEGDDDGGAGPTKNW